MQSVMNLKIKYRESFRPFAPIIKHDKVSEWFAKLPNANCIADVKCAASVVATE
jgi:carbamoyltransferase